MCRTCGRWAQWRAPLLILGFITTLNSGNTSHRSASSLLVRCVLLRGRVVIYGAQSSALWRMIAIAASRPQRASPQDAATSTG